MEIYDGVVMRVYEGRKSGKIEKFWIAFHM